MSYYPFIISTLLPIYIFGIIYTGRGKILLFCVRWLALFDCCICCVCLLRGLGCSVALLLWWGEVVCRGGGVVCGRVSRAAWVSKLSRQVSAILKTLTLREGNNLTCYECGRVCDIHTYTQQRLCDRYNILSPYYTCYLSPTHTHTHTHTYI